MFCASVATKGLSPRKIRKIMRKMKYIVCVCGRFFCDLGPAVWGDGVGMWSTLLLLLCWTVKVNSENQHQQQQEKERRSQINHYGWWFHNNNNNKNNNMNKRRLCCLSPFEPNFQARLLKRFHDQIGGSQCRRKVEGKHDNSPCVTEVSSTTTETKGCWNFFAIKLEARTAGARLRVKKRQPSLCHRILVCTPKGIDRRKKKVGWRHAQLPNNPSSSRGSVRLIPSLLGTEFLNSLHPGYLYVERATGPTDSLISPYGIENFAPRASLVERATGTAIAPSPFFFLFSSKHVNVFASLRRRSGALLQCFILFYLESRLPCCCCLISLCRPPCIRLRHLERASELDPTYPGTCLDLGQLLMQEGAPAEALSMWGRRSFLCGASSFASDTEFHGDSTKIVNVQKFCENLETSSH